MRKMLRLSVLLSATLVGIGLAMLILGDEDLRADRRPAPEPARSIALTEPDPPVAQSAEPEDVVTTPQPEQTPEVQPDFPGPPLEASPEFADAEPARDTPDDTAVADGSALWVTASRLNMRAAPNGSANVVAGLDAGTRLEALAPARDGWVNVRAPDGQSGFVSAQFVSDQPQ
ncbi:MAG: SH3 domain-containing protein [Paracoccus sp. (in: a-proteobacteria)]|nr:SH3 domain-containing protein [Paracoccus sp. (in: a-proteobacteria)]